MSRRRANNCTVESILPNVNDRDGEYTHIVVRGAREHNLQNVDVTIPREQLVVITGVSGSGKSSLAFDTLYAEGKRRYVECLSPYARQFLGIQERPDVDFIEGLSPAIAIEQKTTGMSPRSTVGTITEIYDYLRLLFAKVGVQYCVDHPDQAVEGFNEEVMVQRVMELPPKTKVMVLAPLVHGRKGHYRALFERLRKAGFTRVRVDGEIVELEPGYELSRYQTHTIELVIDRLVVQPNTRGRVYESLQLALEWGKGLVIIHWYDQRRRQWQDWLLSKQQACPICHRSYSPLAPHHFSFNSPWGACPECEGLGVQWRFHPDLLVTDPRRPLLEGAIPLLNRRQYKSLQRLIHAVATAHQIDISVPFEQLSSEDREILFEGTNQLYTVTLPNGETVQFTFPGILQILWEEYQLDSARSRKMEQYMTALPCPACGGKRLKPESLAVRFHGRSIAEIGAMSIADAYRWFVELHLSEREEPIARVILNEIIQRLRFLQNVGLDYLTLDRPANTLSGGEAQRIRLAAQIGAQLVGVLYVLDEPSIGLHPADNHRLIEALKALRDLGNTVIVVEHDRDTIEAADFLIDLGPGAGRQGGQILYAGPLQQALHRPVSDSLTIQYLRGECYIPVPDKRRPGNGKILRLIGASGNNLQNITVEFPLGCFICVTGKSGSGKSSLINETLYPLLARRYHRAQMVPLPYQAVEGVEHLNKVVVIDQSPIGRTPRSNPATYTGVFTEIRKLFAQLPEARVRGYTASRFSFNLPGGRCEPCRGSGVKIIEMNFLPDVHVPCEYCEGRRYNPETLQVKYRGLSIADVLELTISEALELFSDIPSIRRHLIVLEQIGLGYLQLGQSAPTLSGGEAQRVKLATELVKVATGKTLYILDEPTTGLHFDDIRILLEFLHRLVDRGNTVIVVEHNLDVIKTADWIVDLGPGGGQHGGQVVATGTPEQIADHPQSLTGQYLRPLLEQTAAVPYSTTGS